MKYYYYQQQNEVEFPIRSRVKPSKEGINYIEISAPGKSKEDFDVKVDNEKVVVKLKGGEYRENFYLKDCLDKDKIKAVCKFGILTISIPYKKEAVPNKIEVK